MKKRRSDNYTGIYCIGCPNFHLSRTKVKDTERDFIFVRYGCTSDANCIQRGILNDEDL
jgi:hypothetical protein